VTEIHRVNLTKSKLAAMPQAERSLLLLLGHANNEMPAVCVHGIYPDLFMASLLRATIQQEVPCVCDEVFAALVERTMDASVRCPYCQDKRSDAG
jgi:hypothetical protein